VFVEKSGSGEVVPYILTTSPRSNKLSPTYFIKVPLPKISDISAVFLFMTDISPVLTGPWTRGVSVVWADLEVLREESSTDLADNVALIVIALLDLKSAWPSNLYEFKLVAIAPDTEILSIENTIGLSLSACNSNV
jgi:hypothetical protein